MGADLIGCFAKGPRTLPLRAIPAAIAQADGRIQWLKLANQAIERNDDNALLAMVPDCPWLDLDESTEPGQIDLNQLYIEVQHLISTVGQIESLTGREAVDDFVASWMPIPGANCRDVASIVDPDCPDKWIVFAGERSWGDPPNGPGFQLLMRAGVLGIAPVLGVFVEAAFMTLHIPLRKES